MPEEQDRLEPGAGIGHEPEPEQPSESVPAGSVENDPVPDPADQPDEGWQEWPSGHRQGRPADDDLQRRKG